jgi:REP element-mobilizing transposase RayT
MSMVISHHLIWVLYGWWLPNDLRGSTSRFIESDVISELGALHYGRKKVQPSSREIREFYEVAATKLKHKLLKLTPEEVLVVADAFAEVIRTIGYTCYACAVMPDHIHMVIRKHKYLAEEMIEHFQDASRIALINSGAHPEDHPVWGGPGWKVFLDEPDEVRRTINYVDDNPTKMRMPRQRWPFVAPYDNWPFHKRH